MGTQPRESACASSHTMKPKQGNKSKGRKRIAKSHSKPKPKPTSPHHMNLNQEPPTGQDALPTVPIQNPLSNGNSSSSMGETKGEKGKPPKPLPLTTSMSQMPYVTTKGKNGKTVNGFLYRYNISEVSIVCVCHGSTFSPAAFVQHAGGTDIRNPLRLITVTPSALG